MLNEKICSRKLSFICMLLYLHCKYGPHRKSVHSTVNHCNQVYSYLIVFFFSFDCCSKSCGKTVNLKYSDLLYHLHFGIVLCMVNNCAWYSKLLYFRISVFTCVFTVISLYIFAVHCTAVVYTVNISAVKITVFRCVPFPAVLSLYFLHWTTAPITVEKCKHWFTVVYCNIYTSTL